VQQRRHQLRVLGQQPNLLLRLLPRFIIWYQKLPKKKLQMIHSCNKKEFSLLLDCGSPFLNERERESLLSSILLIFFSRLQGAEARSQLKLFLKFMNPTQRNSRRVSPLLPIAGDKTKGCNIASKQTGTTPRAPNPNPNPNPSFFPPTSEIPGLVLRLGAWLCGSPAPLPCLLLSFFFCRLYLSTVFFCLFVSSSSRKMPAFAVVAEEEHEENDATDLLHQVRSFFPTFLQLFCVLVRFTSVAAAAFVGFGICRFQR